MKKQKIKIYLQRIVVAAIVIVPVLFTILKFNSEPHDSMVKLMGIILAIASSLWFGYSIVITIKYGSKEQPFHSLISSIRRQLNNMVSLYLITLIASASIFFLCYQLLLFRQVEFHSEDHFDLYVNNAPIGTIKMSEVKKFRLKTGQVFIHWKEVKGGKKIKAFPPITIEPFWEKVSIDRLNLEKIENYEPTN